MIKDWLQHEAPIPGRLELLMMEPEVLTWAVLPNGFEAPNPKNSYHHFTTLEFAGIDILKFIETSPVGLSRIAKFTVNKELDKIQLFLTKKP